ncbi:MAG: hypothetical protein ACU0CT_03600 [Paracoccaceae bacterium]
MATISKIIDRAYRKLGVKAADEALTADQLEAGLDALNELVTGWQLHGINVSIYDMRSTDEFPLAPRFEEAVIYMLASRLSPEYVVPAGFDYDGFLRLIQAQFVEIPTSSVDGMLTETTSQRQWRGYPR